MLSEATEMAEAAITNALTRTPELDRLGVTPPPPLKLYAAMHKARIDMTTVSKSGYNAFDKYNYATLVDYVTASQEPLNGNGLLVTNDVTHHEFLEDRKTRNDGIEHVVRIRLRTRVIHSESGEWMSIETLGEGQDRGDKAYYKAVTGARKYALAMLFNLATDDDPETDSHENQAAASKAHTAAPPARPPIKTAPPVTVAKVPVDNPAELEKARLQIRGLPLDKMLAIIGAAESVELLELAVDGCVGGPVYQTLPEWGQVIAGVRERYGKLTTAGDNNRFADFLAKMRNHAEKWKLDKAAEETFAPTPEQEAPAT